MSSQQQTAASRQTRSGRTIRAPSTGRFSQPGPSQPPRRKAQSSKAGGATGAASDAQTPPPDPPHPPPPPPDPGGGATGQGATRIQSFVRHQGQSQGFLNQPAIRAAAGLPPLEAADELVDIEGVHVPLIEALEEVPLIEELEEGETGQGGGGHGRLTRQRVLQGLSE